MEALIGISYVVFERYFKAGYNSFQILFNSRYNSKISGTEVIKELADVIGKMNPLNVVDLSNPTHTVLVEVVRNVICLSVVKDYAKLKKYNLLACAGIEDVTEKTPAAAEEMKSDVEEADVGGQGDVPSELEVAEDQDGEEDAMSTGLEYDGGDS